MATAASARPCRRSRLNGGCAPNPRAVCRLADFRSGETPAPPGADLAGPRHRSPPVTDTAAAMSDALTRARRRLATAAR
ncbi:MAG: hypothetical protein LW860_17130, partial [Xanthomonadaceae bacterium]|nr:hypothetical protein [Xanthomonadaceae bacterium]